MEKRTGKKISFSFHKILIAQFINFSPCATSLKLELNPSQTSVYILNQHFSPIGPYSNVFQHTNINHNKYFHFKTTKPCAKVINTNQYENYTNKKLSMVTGCSRSLFTSSRLYTIITRRHFHTNTLKFIDKLSSRQAG